MYEKRCDRREGAAAPSHRFRTLGSLALAGLVLVGGANGRSIYNDGLRYRQLIVDAPAMPTDIRPCGRPLEVHVGGLTAHNVSVGTCSADDRHDSDLPVAMTDSVWAAKLSILPRDGRITPTRPRERARPTPGLEEKIAWIALDVTLGVLTASTVIGALLAWGGGYDPSRNLKLSTSCPGSACACAAMPYPDRVSGGFGCFTGSATGVATYTSTALGALDLIDPPMWAPDRAVTKPHRKAACGRLLCQFKQACEPS